MSVVGRTRFAVSVILAAMTVVSCSGRSDAAPEAVVRDTIEGMANLWVAEELLLSGQPTAEAFAILAERGVEVVIDLRHPDERPNFDESTLVRSLGMDYRNFPFGSPEELTDELLDQVRSSLRQHSGHKTLLHCKSGNRVGAVWLAFRVLDDGISWEEALGQAHEVGLRSAALEERVTVYVSDPIRVRWMEVKQRIRAKFPDVEQVSVEALAQRLQAGVDVPLILDVREEEEYDVSHLANALRAVSVKEALKILDGVSPDREITVYCSVGYRSAKLAAGLAQKGFSNVTNLEGSIFEWANAGHPVYRSGKGKPEPVRQVHPYNEDWGRLLDSELWSRSP